MANEKKIFNRKLDHLYDKKGCMTQEAFASLKSFIVAENNLDQTAVETLKNLFPLIVIGEQKNPHNQLYVSVGE